MNQSRAHEGERLRGRYLALLGVGTSAWPIPLRLLGTMMKTKPEMAPTAGGSAMANASSFLSSEGRRFWCRGGPPHREEGMDEVAEPEAIGGEIDGGGKATEDEHSARGGSAAVRPAIGPGEAVGEAG